MPPVRILYIIESMGAGGTEKQLGALIRGFKTSTAVQAHLCTLRPSESCFASLSVPKIELGIRRLFGPRTAMQLIRLARFCRHHQINLVQTFFQDPTLIGAILKTVLPVRLVVSFRDLGFWRTRAENLKMRLACPWADGFIANSLAVKTHFVDADRIRPSKIEVINNGFESRRVAANPALRTATTERPIVGIVGNFNRAVKRMGDFIEAAALIKKEYENARFVIIGDGHEKNDLVRRCRDLRIADAVVFAGRLDDPLDQIRQFTVGVSTSESEGFSNAVIEYMACGLPVVVTDVGGNKEMVAQGINGFRVPVGDTKALADRVVELLGNPTLCGRLGRENIKTVQTMYAMEKMIQAHETYYLGLLAT
jgi:glycosyltransferase involved in cell wall biosynthesis